MLKWDALPPPLPPKARYHLETKALTTEATEGAADVIQQDEHLFSHPMGKFRLDLSDQGTLILQHLRVRVIRFQTCRLSPYTSFIDVIYHI